MMVLMVSNEWHREEEEEPHDDINVDLCTREVMKWERDKNKRDELRIFDRDCSRGYL